MKTRLSLFFFLFCACCAMQAQASSADTFDWRRANVYFVITDRFCNGDPQTECYSGQQATVQNGVVRLSEYMHGVAVLCEIMNYEL